MSETAKIREKLLKYCGDLTMDLGCGGDKIKPDAFGVDGRALPGVDLVTMDIYNLLDLLPDRLGSFDAVFSSHFLEHIPDTYKAVGQWLSFLKPGGYLVLYLPDTRHYNDVANPEHVHSLTYEVFVRWFMMAFPGTPIVDHGPDVGPDRYSFFLVGQKGSGQS